MYFSPALANARSNLMVQQQPDERRILIVSDAWKPQVNGVVRTLESVGQILKRKGHQLHYVTPEQFINVPLPSYPDIRLALFAKQKIIEVIFKLQPHHIHIATEGPLGLSARQICVREKYSFTTSFHTKFPEYVETRIGMPAKWTYGLLQWFHSAAKMVMVSTPSLEARLRRHGFEHLCRWTRGVDTTLFRPWERSGPHRQGPVFVYVGRIAVEKNIYAFLDIDLPGSKLVIGDGPQLPQLRTAYPEVKFIGALHGEALSQAISQCDVLVFPSRTDTYGLVLLEALACGVPVAAFPVEGPLDVIGPQLRVGCLSENLQDAALAALKIDRHECRQFALRHTWEDSAAEFLSNLVPVNASVYDRRGEIARLHHSQQRDAA